MKPLRIGMIAHAGLGGSGTVALEMARGLASRGHVVHLVTSPSEAKSASEPGIVRHVLEAPTHAMWPAPPWVLALASLVAQVAENESLDVLHAHFALPYAVSADLARELMPRKIGLVVTLHGTDVTQLADEPAYAPWIARTVRRADAITVPSCFLFDQVSRRFGEQRLSVVSNFVDTQQFKPDGERSAPSEQSEIVVVHASNFRPVKRTDDVVDAFARVAARLPARLLLVGDGPTRASTLARLAERGLSDRVEAPGAVSQVQTWLARAHVALLPSGLESFGLVALEAQACGTPVVATRVGGLPEVVEHGETGWLEPVGDVAALADRIIACACSPELWNKVSRQARLRATTFSPSIGLDAIEICYRTAIHRALGAKTTA